MTTTENLKLYYERSAELYRIGCIASLLGWDLRVYMPPNGAQARAEQIEYLSVMMHAKSTDSELGKAVDDLAEVLDTLSPDDQVNIRETKRSLDKARKLPPEFVAELAQTSSLAYSEWVKARPANDFKAVQSLLEKLVALCKQQADLVGYEEHPYDALLDDYEHGSKLSIVKPLLLALGEDLRKIIPDITARQGCDELKGSYPTDLQAKLCRRVTESLGFSFDSGRIDITAHPFMSTIGPRDFRITTRYDESDYRGALYGTIHETGHALYEFWLSPEWVGTPRGEPVSLSVHESQSRLWENLVGRSREFSIYLSGVMQDFFPGETDPEQLWRKVNCVKPSLIRTEADEVTYSQHVVIRMLLEEQLITGDLTVAELPDAWNDLYEKYLGIRPTDFKNGVMQDVHWYSGAIGYFPTYALGNLYGAMMMEKARTEIDDLPGKTQRGEFAPMLNWLRENVHKHGMTHRGPQLIKNITGKELTAEAFVRYLKEKFLGKH